jgi:hypothetical protein
MRATGRTSDLSEGEFALAELVRAGRDLACFADVPEAAETRVGLLLDVEDTAVTQQTAEASQVGTVAAIRLIALAVAAADDNQADWLHAGVHDAVVGLGRSRRMSQPPRTRLGGSRPSGGRGHLVMVRRDEALICVGLPVGEFMQPSALFVEGAVADCCEEDADAVAGEAEKCLGVGLR